MKALVVVILLSFGSSAFAQMEKRVLLNSIQKKFERSKASTLQQEKISLTGSLQCIIVNTVPYQKVIGTHTLDFEDLFEYKKAVIRFNSGQVAEAFIDLDQALPNQVAFHLEQAPNHDLNDGIDVYLRSSDGQIFAEWVVDENEFLKRKDSVGKGISFHAAFSLLPSSKSQQGGRALFYSHCRQD